MSDTESRSYRHFIHDLVDEDLRSGRFDGRVHTRFPPEPNGYLHIGHAKSICLNFELAEQYGGKCNLRFDDTNPIKEEQEYIDSIIEDIRWLGFAWEDRLYHASDYFEQMYEWARLLIQRGKAYVDDSTADQIREMRGTLTQPGKESPHRNRSSEENLELFEQMRAGAFPDGSRTLRAKIDMSHPNLNMRDPVMYRILHAPHPHAGSRWCIYPMYDWAHGLEDSIENITHSICTLEFENHRPLYDWFLESLDLYHPQQIEFARLNMTHTVMSKRKLLELVRGNHVRGWDDPRMPTLSGMRRRGVPPEAIRAFCRQIGVSKVDSVIDVALFEHVVRDHLNRTAMRAMAVLDPIKVVIEDYPADRVEMMQAVNNPEDPAAGSREVPFSQTLYIERDDFREQPPPKYFRLALGVEVRLRYAYWIRCVGVIKDDSGNIIELRCTYDPQTRGGNNPPDGRKVKSTLHWVSASHAAAAEVRLYDHLLSDRESQEQGAGGHWLEQLNPNSLTVARAYVEPSLKGAVAGSRYQFERLGYFCVDPDKEDDALVFNRIVTLKDTWAKLQKRSGK